MACSKFEYVKQFESHATLLKNTFVIVRLDGHAFTRFTKEHDFIKPNDIRGINLMNESAKTVMEEFKDIMVSYGQSDEYSFMFKRSSTLYQRREAKIITNICSLFTAAYVSNWSKYFDIQLKFLPSFDARAVCYPTIQNVRDYFSWRQADCHINNLYNTCFWEIVKDDTLAREKEAEAILKDTDSGKKNELLFSKYGINYNNIDSVYRKGSVLYRKKVSVEEIAKSGKTIVRLRPKICVEHDDIIGNEFWERNSELLIA